MAQNLRQEETKTNSHGRVKQVPGLRSQPCCPPSGNLRHPPAPLFLPLKTLRGYQPHQGDDTNSNRMMFVNRAHNEPKERGIYSVPRDMTSSLLWIRALSLRDGMCFEAGTIFMFLHPLGPRMVPCREQVLRDICLND